MADFNAGIGEIVSGKSPDTLSATALGSCIGLVLYDPFLKFGVLAHIALPSVENSIKKAKQKAVIFPGRYADVAINKAIKIIKQQGAMNIRAKIAGGSKIFDIDVHAGKKPHIGKRSLMKVEYDLKKHNIRIESKDVDGPWSRTIQFFPENGMMMIKKTSLGNGKNEYNTSTYFI